MLPLNTHYTAENPAGNPLPVAAYAMRRAIRMPAARCPLNYPTLGWMRVATAIQEPITVILVDDESGSLRDLERKLRSFPELTILAAVTRQSLAISLIRQLQPDVIFLDIAMPHMNGFQLLAELGDYHSKVVFTAPYDHYSIEALRMNAFDYLVKPVDTAALRETVARLTRLIRG